MNLDKDVLASKIESFIKRQQYGKLNNNKVYYLVNSL